MSITFIVIGIISSLIILSIIAWTFITSRGFWWIKLLLVTLLFSIVFLNIYLYSELQGTPKKLESPVGLVVKSYIISEPTEYSRGQIYLWILTDTEPLNVVLPYNRELHKQLTENRGLKNNMPQRIGKRKNNGEENKDGYYLHDILPWMKKPTQ